MTVSMSNFAFQEEDLVLKQLEDIEWIKGDSVLRSKLREIAFRIVELRRFLGLKAAEPNVDEEKRTNVQLPDQKRPRGLSESSICEEKRDRNPTVVQAKESEPVQATSNEWECKKCTFMNASDTLTSCAICGSFKPRSEESTGVRQPAKRDHVVELYIKAKIGDSSPRKAPQINRKEDNYSEILSRGIGGEREHQLTGKSSASSPHSECTVYASPFNLLVSGQAQEESTWINALERDVFAQHNLDEELLFTKRYLAAKKLCPSEVGSTEENKNLSTEHEIFNHYASACN